MQNDRGRALWFTVAMVPMVAIYALSITTEHCPCKRRQDLAPRLPHYSGILVDLTDLSCLSPFHVILPFTPTLAATDKYPFRSGAERVPVHIRQDDYAAAAGTNESEWITAKVWEARSRSAATRSRRWRCALAR